MSRKLPETIKTLSPENEVIGAPLGNAIDQIVKKFKIKKFENTDLQISLEPKELVKNFFSAHFNATDENPAELPDGFGDYQKVWTQVADVVRDHHEAEKVEKNNKDAQKEAKAQQRQADKDAKAAEDRGFTERQEKFNEIFQAKYADLDYGTKVVSAIVSKIKLPDSVHMAESGMGVVIADNASIEDIMSSIASVTSAMEGQANLQGALQFVAGDLVNKAVSLKLFRTKNEAQSHIAHVLKDKMNKKFSAGSLNQYALMAERVGIEDRKLGVSPSVYLQASKIVAPKLEAPKNEVERKNAEQLSKDFDAKRNEVIAQINKGEISDMKGVAKVFEDFKKEKNVYKEKDEPVNVRLARHLGNYFFATWVKENIMGVNGEEDTATFEIEGGKKVTMSLAELTDKQEEAKRELETMLIPNVKDVVAGTKEVEETEGEGKDKKKVKKNVEVLLPFPFQSKSE